MSTNTNSVSSNGGPATTGGAQLITAAPREFRQRISLMIAGIQAAIPDGSSVVVGGQTLAKADLVTQLMQISSVYQAVDAGVLATKAARSQLSEQLPGFHKQYTGFKDAILAFLGRGNPRLAQFGLTVSKGSKPLSSAQKVIRAEKARKTRAMRHTMGKVQKAAVRYSGDLAVVVNQTTLQAPGNGIAPAAAPQTQGTAVTTAPAATPVVPDHSQ